MKRILLLLSTLALAAAPLSVSAAVVTAAEYFINADPSPGNGTVVPASSPGVTTTFAINIPPAIISALPEGPHTLACRVKDDAGNWSIAFSRTFFKETTAPVDNTVPTVSIGVVTPNPRNSAVGSLSIVFSEPVTGLNVADLTLTRNGGVNLLTASQTLSSTDNMTFVLGGLTSLTGVEGTYSVTLRAGNSGIADNAGNLLATDAAESWVVDGTSPTASIAAVSPDPRNSAVGSLTIMFSEPVTGLDLADIALTRNGGANLVTASQTLSTTDNTTFVLGGLTTITGVEGTYTVTLRAANTGIADRADNLLAADSVESWTMDRTPPTANIAAVTPDPRNTAVGSLGIVFSEPVSGFNAADLVLTRNGGANLLNGSEALATLDTKSFTLSGMAAVAETDGSYVLSLRAANSGISDAAGNLLASDASESWLVDRTPPTVSIATITPDPRNSAVSSISILFSEPVTGLNVPDLTLTRNGGPNLLTGAETLSSADNVAFALSGLAALTTADGVYTLALRAAGSGITDAMDNSLADGASVAWTMAAALIVVAEYFIDTDPGPGNGIPVAVASPVWPLSLAVDIPASVIAGLPDGPHFLTCRVRDGAGNWSIAYSRAFHKENPVEVPPALVEFIEMQWFLNGAVASNPVLARAAAPAREVSLVLQASIVGLTETGTYQLLVTPIDSLGNRGIGVARPVFIDPSTVPQALSLSALRRLPDGSVQLTFSGEAGRTYTLQGSSNLRDWIDVQTVASGSSTLQITGGNASAPQQFFRLRTP